MALVIRGSIPRPTGTVRGTPTHLAASPPTPLGNDTYLPPGGYQTPAPVRRLPAWVRRIQGTPIVRGSRPGTTSPDTPSTPGTDSNGYPTDPMQGPYYLAQLFAGLLGQGASDSQLGASIVPLGGETGGSKGGLLVLVLIVGAIAAGVWYYKHRTKAA